MLLCEASELPRERARGNVATWTRRNRHKPTPSAGSSWRGKPFKEFSAICFWSYRTDFEIEESDIPWIVRELRYYGGHRGYRVAAELCR